MKPKKPKKKEVTMWAICDPKSGWFFLEGRSFVALDFDEYSAWCSAKSFLKPKIYTMGRLKKLGYRAIKGKFVWEEK